MKTMPYQDERAGLASILAIAESGVVDEFRNRLAERHDVTPLPLPALRLFRTGVRASMLWRSMVQTFMNRFQALFPVRRQGSSLSGSS